MVERLRMRMLVTLTAIASTGLLLVVLNALLS